MIAEENVVAGKSYLYHSMDGPVVVFLKSIFSADDLPNNLTHRRVFLRDEADPQSIRTTSLRWFCEHSEENK